MGKAARAKSQRRDPSQIVQRYAKAASVVLPALFGRRDCCVNGTRIAIEVLQRFGVEAVPVATQCRVMNALWFQKMRELERLPQSDAEVEEWCQTGAWAVGSSGVTDGHGYGNHLIAYVPKSRYVIDSAAGQFSRPEREIKVPQAIAGLTDVDMLKGSLAILVGEGDVVVSYQPLLDEKSFRFLPGWQFHDDNKTVAYAIEATMRKMEKKS